MGGRENCGIARLSLGESQLWRFGARCRSKKHYLKLFFSHGRPITCYFLSHIWMAAMRLHLVAYLALKTDCAQKKEKSKKNSVKAHLFQHCATAGGLWQPHSTLSYSNKPSRSSAVCTKSVCSITFSKIEWNPSSEVFFRRTGCCLGFVSGRLSPVSVSACLRLTDRNNFPPPAVCLRVLQNLAASQRSCMRRPMKRYNGGRVDTSVSAQLFAGLSQGWFDGNI